GCAQIVAASFLLDHRVVDLPGRAVVAPAHPGLHEAFIVAEVEIGLCAVVGYEHFAVLSRTHGAGVDVDVGVHLQHRHLEAACFQEPPRRARRQSLPQRGAHPAGYENEFGFPALHHDDFFPPTSAPKTPEPGPWQGPQQYLSQAMAPRKAPPGLRNHFRARGVARVFRFAPAPPAAGPRTAAGTRADRRIRRCAAARRRELLPRRADTESTRAKNTARCPARRAPLSRRSD